MKNKNLSATVNAILVVFLAITLLHAEEEKKKDEKEKSNSQLLIELEKAVFTDPFAEKVDARGKPLTAQALQAELKKMKDLDAKIQKSILSATKGDEINDLKNKYTNEILILGDNYKRAAAEAKFPSQGLTFQVQTMFQTYAEFYKALLRSDSPNNITGLKLILSKARQKQYEVRQEILSTKK